MQPPRTGQKNSFNSLLDYSAKMFAQCSISTLLFRRLMNSLLWMDYQVQYVACLSTGVCQGGITRQILEAEQVTSETRCVARVLFSPAGVAINHLTRTSNFAQLGAFDSYTHTHVCSVLWVPSRVALPVFWQAKFKLKMM